MSVGANPKPQRTFGVVRRRNNVSRWDSKLRVTQHLVVGQHQIALKGNGPSSKYLPSNGTTHSRATSKLTEGRDDGSATYGEAGKQRTTMLQLLYCCSIAVCLQDIKQQINFQLPTSNFQLPTSNKRRVNKRHSLKPPTSAARPRLCHYVLSWRPI